MKLIRNIPGCLFLMFFTSQVHAQLYKINLIQKIEKASLIVEGRVVEQHTFWNAGHTMIYTSSTLQLYKLFKGNIASKQIEVVTQGGSIDNRCLVVSDVLQLRTGDVGMFFCLQNALRLRSM